MPDALQRLTALVGKWEAQAVESIAESSRIRSVRSDDSAIDRCLLRAEMWRRCAAELRDAALTDSAEQPEARFDLLEDPTRGLHAVLTSHGIASRRDYEKLVTALVCWAADAYRSSAALTDSAPRVLTDTDCDSERESCYGMWPDSIDSWCEGCRNLALNAFHACLDANFGHHGQRGRPIGADSKS